MKRYLACELPTDLADRLFSASKQLQQNTVDPKQVDAAAQVLLELVELTMNYYFLRPVEILGLGTFGHTTVRLGIKTARSGMAMIINRLARRLTSPQRVILARLMEDFVLETET